MNPLRGPALACLAAMFACACTSHTHEPYDPDRAILPVDASRYTDPLYRHLPTWPAHANSRIQAHDTRHHTASRIHFPSVGDNGQPGQQVEGIYYRARLAGEHPLAIILPIWGSHRYPSEKVTAGILRRRDDIHVFHLLGENYLLDWEGLALIEDEEQIAAYAQAHAARMRVAVADILQIVDWAETLEEVDPGRIGLVGFSISALVGSAVLANEPRIAAGILVMGGGQVEEIAAYCPGRPGMAREHVMENFGWSRERYREVFREAFAVIDRSYRPGRVDPSRILMIDSRHDECMPAATREDLWMRMGFPERITYSYGHKSSFLAMTPLGFNKMRRQVYDFVDRAL